MAELRKLVCKRKTIRGRVTSCHNNRGCYQSFTDLQRSVERANLLDYKEELNNLNDVIQNLKCLDSDAISDDDLQKEMDSCAEYQSKIKECIVYLDSLKPSNSSHVNSGQVEAARSLLKQPVAPLPSFSGDENEDLMKFIREFELTTSSYNYPDRDLLILLLQQLSGKAKTLLNSLEADKQSYKDAKDLLITAFASPENRKFGTISKLSTLQLGYENDPFEFISKVKMLSESVTSLKIVSDDFLQFFVWRGLNENFKSHLTQITNKTKPSFKEIVDNFFVANERYSHAQKLYKAKKSNSPKPQKNDKVSTSFAVKVNSKSSDSLSKCSLCSNVDKSNNHPIYSCPAFKTAKEKLDKIKSLNGCSKCASLKHKFAECRFKFKRKCRYCSGWHFDFLCSQWSTGSQTGQDASPRSNALSTEAKSGVVNLQTLSCNTLLPTFSFCVNENGTKLRALNDRGSQSSFITENAVVNQKLKVLQKNVKLTVSGFNAPQSYISSLVEVPLRFGSNMHLITAFVVPDIKVNLNLPQLGTIVHDFLNKGYSLADSFLNEHSDKIVNIDFVLGSDASHCLVGSDICFGNRSMYVDTAVGVLLLGDINHIVHDLPHLPFCKIAESSIHVSESFNNVQSVSETESISSSFAGMHLTHAFFVSDFVQPFSHNNDELDFASVKASSNLNIFRKGKLVHSKLQEAADQILESECYKYTNYDIQVYNDESVELHDTLVDYTLRNISRNADGRIIVPLLWNGKVSHLLSKNQHLSKSVLKSNLKRLSEDQLKLMDQTIKDQVEAGIIEQVENIGQFLLEHPEHSFLPHMGIFKLDRETTKCRVVFLSNLCEKDPSKKLNISHNQAMFAGPTLNQKLSSALLQLRFGAFLLTYDLKKAFNQLLLNVADQNKLLFYWYRNIGKRDFSLVAYRNVRLSFGLRCSPFLLMISLYYILVLESESDPAPLRHLKHLMYSLLYMDNGAITCDTRDKLIWAFEQLTSIFSPYKFDVQQLMTNDLDLQDNINQKLGESPQPCTKLFGLLWDRNKDVIFTKPIDLNPEADTKRTILKSIASQFDIYNYNMPVLNRSRLFMHSLQCNKAMGWDEVLTPDLKKEWRNICKQVNSTPRIEVKRYVGPRDGSYKLYAFTDASHAIYGTVVYLQHIESGNLSFITAKNRLISPQLKLKSIPSLELNAINLGVQTLMEIYRDLSGPSCLMPINITELNVFTDSLCCLHWLNLASNKLDKMQKRSVFVINRLQSILKMCEKFPVQFSFISGKANPADCVTRCISYKQLLKSNFLSGPDLCHLLSEIDVLSGEVTKVVIPDPRMVSNGISVSPEMEENKVLCSSSVPLTSFSANTNESVFLLDPSHFSSFRRLVLLYRRLLNCVQKWKLKAGIKADKFDNAFAEATRLVIKLDQRKYFPEVFDYFLQSKVHVTIPPIVSQLNVYLDGQGLLRVKCKFKKWLSNQSQSFPILLHTNSDLTKIIVLDTHIQLAHSGCYSVLAELRRHFYIPKHFSAVKKYLKKCCHCQRFNARTIKINQSQYREFRAEPPKIPFSNIFIDHLGPITVKKNNQNEKVWLLCVTCTWTRAINLKICHDLSLKEFLRAFQMHCFEFGIPQLCISDLGSQFTAGFNLLSDWLNDPETSAYFESNNVKPLSFQQYFKGCSELGSLIEICVKLVKRLLFGSIKKNILSYYEFEFLVSFIVHLVNRRPIAFKEALRDSKLDSVPEPITPEHLIRGYALTSLNLIPDLHVIPSSDPDWQLNTDKSSIRDNYDKLRKVRKELLDRYQDEFLGTLIAQAVDRKDRYRPVKHNLLQAGDIVLLKEINTKPNDYPLGIVKRTVTNDNGEVTGAFVMKGRTRELVKRHSSTLIPVLRDSNNDHELSPPVNDSSLSNTDGHSIKRPIRKAAAESRIKTKLILRDEL